MKYYSAIKRNQFESVLMRWMKLEPAICFSHHMVPSIFKQMMVCQNLVLQISLAFLCCKPGKTLCF